MQAGTGGVAKPTTADRSRRTLAGPSPGTVARPATPAPQTMALATRTAVWPWRSARRPSSGPPALWAMARAPPVSPAIANDPVRACTWTSTPIASIASGSRAAMETTKSRRVAGEEVKVDMGCRLPHTWTHEKIQEWRLRRDQLGGEGERATGGQSADRPGGGHRPGRAGDPRRPGRGAHPARGPRRAPAGRHADAVDPGPRPPARRLETRDRRCVRPA